MSLRILLKRIDDLAYELEMFKESKIHNLFHMSCLKKVLGIHIEPLDELPLIDKDDKLVFIYEAIMDKREMKVRNKITKD